MSFNKLHDSHRHAARGRETFAPILAKKGNGSGNGSSGAPATVSDRQVAGWPRQLILNIGDAAPHLFPRITEACEKLAAAIASGDEPLGAEAQKEIDAVVTDGLPLLASKLAPRFSGRYAATELAAHRAGAVK